MGLGFLNKLHTAKRSTFGSIEGYQDLKDIIDLETDENYNLLLVGPPASSKTLFLMGILELRKDAVYFDGSNTTNRILDVLEQERPKVICIDELDKIPRQFQNQLLNFMESGRVKVDQQRKQYDFMIKGAKIFATANELSRLSKPLQSRFRKLFLPKYTEAQFISVAVKVLPKVSDVLARYIGHTIYESQGDIRDVISVGKLIRKNDGPSEVDGLIKTLLEYGAENGGAI